jgi:hypothetical protein
MRFFHHHTGVHFSCRGRGLQGNHVKKSALRVIPHASGTFKFQKELRWCGNLHILSVIRYTMTK